MDVTTKCSLLKCSCKRKLLQKQVKLTVKSCSTWVEVLQRLEKTFPVYETDLSVRIQIEKLPMLPELPSAAQICEYVCDPYYMCSRMTAGSSGPTEPHLWLVGKIPLRMWEDCRSTSERKRRIHTYNDLVDLLIDVAVDREPNSHMENFLKRHLAKCASPTSYRGESTGSKTPSNLERGGGKGGGNLRVRKRHCHVFLVVLDPGQAPPEPWENSDD